MDKKENNKEVHYDASQDENFDQRSIGTTITDETR